MPTHPFPSELVPVPADDLRELITYLWADEEADHAQDPAANGIFPLLQRLKAALPEEN